jgi:Subtilase family
MPKPKPNYLSRALSMAGLLIALAACGGGDAVDRENGGDLADAAERERPLAVAPPPPDYKAWQESTNVVVMLKGANASIDTIASKLNARVVDRLGTRPVFLLAPGLPGPGAGAALLASVRLAMNDGGGFAELNVATFTAEADLKADPVAGIKNSVSAIGEARLSSDLESPWAESQFKLEGLARVSDDGRGRGITVAVLDTGIAPNHQDFRARLVLRGGQNLVDGELIPYEQQAADGLGAFGHGTHVAGILATVAPEARILPIRVLDPRGQGTVWSLAKGVMLALDPDGNPATDDGAAVLNLSLGTREDSKLLRLAMDIAVCAPRLLAGEDFAHPGFSFDRTRCGSAYRQQALVFAGTGNVPGAGSLYPAALASSTPGVVAVTASDSAHRVASFASVDAAVTIAAPGDRITSTFPPNRYATMSGTSMAAPWAAGTAARVLSSTPPVTGSALLPRFRWWGNSAVVARMTANVTPLCATVRFGQVDPVAAVTNGRMWSPGCGS